MKHSLDYTCGVLCSNCNGNRVSPACEDAPTQFTPAMEEVMRRRAERLSSSSSEGDGYTSSSSSGEGPTQMIYTSSSESEDSNDADATVYYSPIAPSPPSVQLQQSNNSNSKSSSRGKWNWNLLTHLSLQMEIVFFYIYPRWRCCILKRVCYVEKLNPWAIFTTWYTLKWTGILCMSIQHDTDKAISSKGWYWAIGFVLFLQLWSLSTSHTMSEGWWKVLLQG